MKTRGSSVKVRLQIIFYQVEVRRLQGQEYLLDIQLFRIKKRHMPLFLERSVMPTTETPFKT